MIFRESKDDLIKVFEVKKETKISYIISTFLNILNRWNNIRIYVFNINNKGNDKK
jgi:hypothetical protein